MDVQTLLRDDRFAGEACIRPVSWRDGDAVLEVELTEKHLNANGVAQGGLIFTLADTAFAVAANAGPRDAVTQSCTVNFLRPGSGSKLTAHASVFSSSRSVCCADVTVTDDRGREVAKLLCTGHYV